MTRLYLLLILLCSVAFADDAAELQAAIDAGPVALAREYEITRPIVLRTGTHLSGGRLILRGMDRAGLLQIESGASGVTLDGVDVDASECHTAVRNQGECSNVRITRCNFSGRVGTTIFMVSLDGRFHSFGADGCRFSSAANHIRIRGPADSARIARCSFTDWRSYAVHLRATSDGGPRDASILANDFRNPSAGTYAAARQAIVCYGDEGLVTPSITGVRIIGNVIEGPGEFWEPSNEASNGTADQIVLHYCRDFVVRGNQATGGGEIGCTVCRFSSHGTIEGNEFSRSDAHGLQIGSADDTDRYLLDTFDIDVLNNVFLDNGKRLDGKPDTMAALHIQNASHIRVSGNRFADMQNPRRQKYAALVTVSDSIDLEANEVEYADRRGAVRYGVFGSTNVRKD